METDRLIGTADEAVPSFGPSTPEGILYEIFARPTKATPRKDQRQSRAVKEVEGETQVVSVAGLYEEQRRDT